MRPIHIKKTKRSRFTLVGSILVMALMLLASGCVGGQQLTKKQRESIRTVSINEVKCDTLAVPYTKNLKNVKISLLNERARKTFGIVAYGGSQPPEEFMLSKDYVLLSPSISGVRTRIGDSFGKVRIVLDRPKSISFLDGFGRQCKIDLFYDPICYIIQDKKLWLVPSNVDSATMQYWAQNHHLGPRAMIYFAMARNNIDVGQIVNAKFTTGIRNWNLFSVVPAGGDASFNFTCGWSFEGKPGPSDHLKPFLDVRATLARSYGDLVWKDRGYTHYLSSKTPSHTIEEYLNNPALIKETIEIAAQLAVDDLIKSLRKE